MKFALAALAAVVPAVFVAASLEDPAQKPQVDKAVDKAKEAPAPVYDEQAIGKDQIAAALAKAKKENRRVLIQWGANWCGWCRMLHDLEKSDKDIARELFYEYDVVKIDIGKWDKHMDLAASYGAELKAHGVPFLTILDADGKVIANQDSGVLELPKESEKKGHDPKKVLELLKGHEATHFEAQKVFDAALAQAKKDGKRVFLHFGAPWCGWCHKLEDWMSRPEVAAILSKDFVELKIDTDRMPGGQVMLDKMSSGKSGGIPWFVFLDADQKPLADSNAAGGNIGFPSKPHEIAHFQSMLERARVNLTSDDIAALVKSLTPPPKPATEGESRGKTDHPGE